jgi:uncharacterized protein
VLRYYSFNQYLKQQFGNIKVYKIPLDAGFTCPNRDGKLGVTGCIYCNNQSFSPNTRPAAKLSISEQIKQGIEFYRKRYQAEKFIAYFQAYTNTYKPVEQLKTFYDEVLQFPEIIGLAIGTRPDCVTDDVLELIAEYNKKPCNSVLGHYLVWLEYGLQSSHNKTLQFIKRGHDYEAFVSAVQRTKQRGIPVCAHIILGLPGENRDDMLKTAQALAELSIEGVKIHHLYVCRDTYLAELYDKGGIKVLSLDEYIPLVCDILEVLPPQMVIQRVMGELDGPDIIAPKWLKSKGQVLNMIEQELTRRGSVQGCKILKI